MDRILTAAAVALALGAPLAANAENCNRVIIKLDVARETTERGLYTIRASPQHVWLFPKVEICLGGTRPPSLLS